MTPPATTTVVTISRSRTGRALGLLLAGLCLATMVWLGAGCSGGGSGRPGTVGPDPDPPPRVGEQPAVDDPSIPRVLPRLVVLVAVDQLGTNVLAAALPFLPPGGFRRFFDAGAVCERCLVPHGCTDTAPGHATLATGAPARVHGVLRNTWYDPSLGRRVLAAVDASAEPLPDLPEGAYRGPGWMLAPDVGQSFKARHGVAAKVAGVGWKDRAAVLMAGAAADLALWFENSPGRWVTNRRYVATTPAWLTDFNAQRVVDSWFGWNWTQSGPAAAYAGLVDDRGFELQHGNGSGQRTLPQPVTGGLLTPGLDYYLQAFASPINHEVTLAAALATIDGLALGGDAVPDLLCVGFAATDAIGHAFGPDSFEARDALLRLDRVLARFCSELDRRVGTTRWTMLVSADHGVGPVPEVSMAAGLPAGRGPLVAFARAAAEAELRGYYGVPPNAERFIREASENTLYLDPAVLQLMVPGRDPNELQREAAQLAARAAGSVRGIHGAYATAELLAYPAPADPVVAAMRDAVHPLRSGDVVVVVQSLWLDGTITASHGSPHEYDRHVPLLLLGAGVVPRSSVRAEVSSGLAPSLAAWLVDAVPPAAAPTVRPAGLLQN